MTERSTPSGRTSRRVGITIFPSKTSFNFFSNGAHQNCLFWWVCLRAAGYDCVLINGGDGDPPTPESMPIELRGIVWHKISDELVDTLDVLIQAGAQVSAEHVARVHARGGRCVSAKFGADFPLDAERAIHNLPTGAIFNGAKFDAIWTTSQHTNVCGAYWNICYRAPVRVLPHIWAPYFVDQITSTFERVEATRSDGSRVVHTIPPIGYQPGRAKKRIAILEPNINFVKTAHIPMLIAEEAFRRAPDLIEHVMVTNALHLKAHLGFSTFIGNLDLQNTIAADGRPMISFEGRQNTPYFMSQNADVVVSHQWIPVPNYSHYDLIHLGYPIVHNVQEMRDVGVGYYYEGFDAKEGGAALHACLRWHDSAGIGASDRENGRRFLATRLATSRENVEAHARAVERLFE